MSTTSYPWSQKATTNVTMPLYTADIQSDFALLMDEPGECAYINTTSPKGMDEKVSFKYTDLKKVSGVQGTYPVSSQKGYQFVVKDEFIVRQTDDKGVSYDDPMTAYVVVRSTNGCALNTGDQVLKTLERLLGLFVKYSNEGALTSQTTLDKMIHGAVKQ